MKSLGYNLIQKMKFLAIGFLLVVLALPAQAQFNQQVNYQGKLVSNLGVAVANGNYPIVFKLYTVATSGAAIWSESRFGSNQVTVTSGLFSVMLGSVSSLSGVDFNQTLYLGVTVASDTEMLPRKVLGTVPAAFESKNTQTLGGLASTSFVRTDRDSAIASTTTNTLLTITQNGTGNILDLLDGATNVFTVRDGGNVGIGTTTPNTKLTVGGNAYFAGNLTATGTLAVSGTSSLATTTVTNLTLTSALGIISGGTGVSVYGPGDFLYMSSPTSPTLSRRAIGTTGQILSVVAGVPDWVSTSTLGFASAFSTSAQLASLLSDETGSAGGGLAVFSNAPTFTGTTLFADTSNSGTLAVTGTSLFSATSTFSTGLLANSVSSTLGYFTGNGNTVYKDTGVAVGGGSTAVFNIFGGAAGTTKFLGIGGGSNGNGIYFNDQAGVSFFTYNKMGSNKSILLTVDGRDMAVFDDTNNNIRLSTSNAERLRINPNGNVSIGTTSSSSLLTVGGTMSVFGTSTLATTTINNLTLAQALAATSGGTGLSTITQNQLLIGGAGNTWNQVATSSLGLSAAFTTSAQLAALLSDETGSAGGGLAVFSNAPTFTGTVLGASSTWSNLLSLSGSNANIALGSNYLSGDGDDEGVFVDAAGNVGLGTTTPSARLTLAGLGIANGINFNNTATLKANTATELGFNFAGVDRWFMTGTALYTTTGDGAGMRGTGAVGILPNVSDITAGLGWGGTGILELHAGSNSVDAMTLNNGNVGIGTTTPASRLDVWGDFRVGTSSLPNLFVNTASNFVGLGTTTKYGTEAVGLGGDLALNGRVIAPTGGSNATLGFSSANNLEYSTLSGAVGSFSLINSSPAVGSGMALAFRSSSVQSSGIDSVLESSGNASLRLSTRGSNVLNERLRINPNGNVSIGTTSSSSLLTVAGTFLASGTSTLATSTITNLTLTQALAATSGGTGLSTITQNQLLIGGVGNTWLQVATSSLGLSSSFTNSVQLASLLSDETGSAGGGLAVFSNGPTFTSITNFADLIGTNATITNATTTNLAISSLTSGRVPYLTTGGRLIDSGNLTYDGNNLLIDKAIAGIGTALTLRNSADGQDRGPRLDFSNGFASLSFIDATRGLNSSFSDLRFSVGGSSMTEVMRIDYNRNVGIGTSSPASKLDVWGNFRVGTSSVPLLFADTASGQLLFGTNTPFSVSTFSGTSIGVLDRGITLQNSAQPTRYGHITTDGSGYLKILSSVVVDIGTPGNSATERALRVSSAEVTVNNESVGTINFRVKGTTSDLIFADASTGMVGIGSSTPSSKLTVAGSGFFGGNLIATGTLSISATSTLATSTITNLTLTQALGATSGGTGLSSYATGDLLYASGASTLANRAIGTTGQVLQVVGGLPTWVATSSLGITGGGATTFLALTDTPSSYTASRIMFTNTGATALTDAANFTFDGTILVVPNLSVSGTSTFMGTSTFGNIIQTGTHSVAGLSTLASTTITGFLQLGTTSVASRFNLDVAGFNTAGTAGLNRYYTSTNAASGTQQFGDLSYLRANVTATTTIVGSMFRVEDSTIFGNTIRGLEVQTNRGTNTQGENTALSGFARTFGVRGYTSGDAGATFEPAGGFFETGGTTQGNAIRGYSSTITTSKMLSLFQDTSAFTGTGLLMNFGNSSGSFTATTSKFVDLQNAGTSRFTISAFGTTTIGDGTTNRLAGLQIGFGGLCVDNDGSCVASTSGRISSVSSITGNSDLAEMYFSSENLLPGEIVYAKGNLSVGRASVDTKDKIIGVVSTKPGVTMGFDDKSLTPGESGSPIALTGRVPIRLSDENGVVKVGDELMLSSIPGVAMKATGTGAIIGVALEDFDSGRAYSDTYVNQFGDDIIEPIYKPVTAITDTRISDGCYYGGGNATGEELCVPLYATTTDARVAEAAEHAAKAARRAALDALARQGSQYKTTAAGASVRVGQIVMFVDLRYRYLDETSQTMLASLMLSSDAAIDAIVGNENSVWGRLVTLAHNFVDGVLTLTGIKADKVETKELCVDDVCVTADDLRQLLDQKGQATPPATPPSDPDPDPGTDDSNPPVDNPPSDTDINTDTVAGDTNSGAGTVVETPPVETVPPTEPDILPVTETPTTDTSSDTSGGGINP